MLNVLSNTPRPRREFLPDTQSGDWLFAKTVFVDWRKNIEKRDSRGSFAGAFTRDDFNNVFFIVYVRKKITFYKNKMYVKKIYK